MISTAIILALISAPTCDSTSIPATFLRVKDGDTYAMRAHLPFGVHFDLSIRLKGAKAPELTGLQARAGARAKEFAETWAASYPNACIKDTGERSFERHVSTVCPVGGGQCLAEALIGAGHAVLYDHKKERAKKRRARLRRGKR